MKLKIAIVGRPNVGKSTLFNRLAGRRLALVDNEPGVTRDRREAEGKLADLKFNIVDTAGYEDSAADESVVGRMRAQTVVALDEADCALFLIDGRAGVTPLDEQFADLLRRRNEPVMLVINKCEGSKGQEGIYDSYGLGLGDPVAISAEHAEGLADLYEGINNMLLNAGISVDDDERRGEGAGAHAKTGEPEEGDLKFEFADDQNVSERPLRLAVVGRPNSGKSTLINSLVGEERVITGPEAGITRDTIAVPWTWKGRKIALFDTAGLRKRARVTEKLERLSVDDAMRAVQFAEVVVLLIDALLGPERQDLRIAAHAAEEGRAIIIALNKWDVVDDRMATERDARKQIVKSLSQIRGVKVVRLSALEGKGTDKLMEAVFEADELWNTRITTSDFNRWLAQVTDEHPPALHRGRHVKLRYGAQIKTRPPTFLIDVNRPEGLKGSYERYMENNLRHVYGLDGTPIRFHYRKGKNPYAGRKKGRGR